jgi:hypothetical protein
MLQTFKNAYRMAKKFFVWYCVSLVITLVYALYVKEYTGADFSPLLNNLMFYGLIIIFTFSAISLSKITKELLKPSSSSNLS